MSFKKISFTFTALALVLIAAVLVNITVGGIKQKQAGEKDAFYVVIDAGHGGFDGGAVAADGTLEKDLNLQIALKLDDMCKLLGFRTLLVRDTDRSTMDDGVTNHKKRSDLNNRLKIMGEKENCIFISIHQNEYSTAQPHGTQVFYAPKVSGSDVLAEYLQSAVQQYVQQDNKRVIKAGTSSAFLLYHAVRPAVIVECGFMSNPQDLENLKDEDYQQRLAFAMAAGILNYCEG